MKVKSPKEPYTINDVIFRARKLWYIVMGGIIYSFIYTAISLFIMVELNGEIQDTCVSRQMGRTAIRAAFISDPDFDSADFASLNLHLPPRVQC